MIGKSTLPSMDRDNRGVEENNLKSCLKGGKGVDRHSGEEWICLNVRWVHLTVGDS